ncbi:UspA domain-containing protein [Sphingopyxis fribergensis]|uniref:UspA domain-containing protein n=1 Tax=Sphingopyxis fribergensis TaxID=1515612 RepID=A0A0A7PDL2_9SPHN|nr:universal stress protein [Sphingopyxis fribergensis]AJA08054.1 UspA domain-containing protein [Sphingopyxis fribergensis]
MKNILLLVHDDPGQEARLETALDIVRALDGHLSCLDVTPNPFLVNNRFFTLNDTVELLNQYDSEATNKGVITDRLSRDDVSWSWTDVDGDIAEAVLAAANFADLIILNRALEDYPLSDMRGVASRVVAHTHAPVLAVPESAERFEFDRALVAWDGGASAAAALRAAVPLLALAQDVEIFHAREDEAGLEASLAVSYLARHGVEAVSRVIDGSGTRADLLIAGECEAWGADYIVMGAYGRGRLCETFGGVTKRMLGDSKLPLLMSH